MASKKKKKPAANKANVTQLKGKILSQTVPALTGPTPMERYSFFKMEKPMIKGNKQFDKMTQDAAVMGQDQMDALMQCSTIFARGMEDILKTCMEIAQEAGEKSQNAAKTIMSCKTLNEFTDAQTKLAQASFDDFMSNATRISEKSVKLCTDAFEPINGQMGKAIKRSGDAMAA